MNSGNLAIVVILVALVVAAALVYLFGLPFLIWASIIATFAVLVLLVYLSAGDMFEKPHHPAETK